METLVEPIFTRWKRKRRSMRRDLDPRSPYWLLGGAILGVVLWQAASPPDSWAHALLHQRGIIQPIIMVVGGMILGFLLAKAILLTREINAHHQSGIFKLKDASRQTAEMVLSMSEQGRSLLARRTSKLLTLWINSGSTTQVERTLNNDTEAYDLAYQASYALPKILIWAVPVLGFIGTVLGIGKAIGSFESFISQVEEIDVLRDGLIKVTEGLGTAFDTTFLALTVSLMVMIPLTLIERLEQQLLTKIDLDLRDQILEALPELGGVDEATLQRTISTALATHLPNPDVLVEPARVYAEKAAQHLIESLQPLHKMADEAIAGIELCNDNIKQQAEGIRDALNPEVLVEPARVYAEKAAQNLVESLQPLHKMADEAIAGIESARINTKESAEAIHDALSRGAKRIGDSVDALQPLLDQLNKVSSLSEDLGSELAQLQTGARLRESLSELDSTLNLLKGTLREVSKPRKIMLVEENQQ